MNLPLRNFGKTGIKVPALGYGAGHIGSPDMDEHYVGGLLNSIVDAGVTLIDTARGYHLSEERIGRYLKHRRDELVLSTKVGYGIDGVADWTYDCIVQGVETALKNLQTDRIDIVHLHSCSKEILERGEVISALEKTKQDGKILAIAYSGEQDDLAYAVNCGKFDAFQSSINICDQRTISWPLHQAKEQGMGIIAKRPVANAPWRFSERPVGHYCESYWERWLVMGIQADAPPQELSLRFAAFTWGVDSIIVGTTSIDHLKQNIAALEKGPLQPDLYQHLRNVFISNDVGWVGQV